MTITVSGKPEWQVQESHIQSKVDAIIDSAPGALDTLNELAAALGDDANFSTTLTNNLATKAPLASPLLQELQRLLLPQQDLIQLKLQIHLS